MTQQKGLVVGNLPNHVLNTNLYTAGFRGGVDASLGSIEQDCLDLEGLSDALVLGDHLLGPRNERNWVACTWLELLHMNMDVDAVVLPRHVGEQGSISTLAQALATEENAPPLRDMRPSPTHPICGTAPYAPERYLR